MGDPAARKAVVLELFAATGESIPEDDPIVTGAILFSHKLNEVATLSASHMRAAGEHAATAIQHASEKLWWRWPRQVSGARRIRPLLLKRPTLLRRPLRHTWLGSLRSAPSSSRLSKRR